LMVKPFIVRKSYNKKTFGRKKIVQVYP